MKQVKEKIDPFGMRNPKKKKNEGQALIEFMLLLLVLVTMSYTMLSGFNNAIGKRWEAIVKRIASPTTSQIVIN